MSFHGNSHPRCLTPSVATVLGSYLDSFSTIDSMNQIRIGIAEDNLLAAKAIKRLIENEKDMVVLFHARNGHEVIEQVQVCSPDIILMDIRMPELDGIEAARILQQTKSQIGIIMLTQFDNEEYILISSILGVRSFIRKGSDPLELLMAIRTAYKGGYYLTKKVGGIIQQYLANSYSTKTPMKISESERALIAYICQGYSSSEIGRLINKSHRTVEKYRDDLYEKFGVKTKESLIVEALRNKVL